MMNIENHLTQATIINNFSHVSNLLEQAQVKVTFWGTRVITLQNYTGTLSIDKLVKDLYQAGLESLARDEWTVHERFAGLKSIRLIANFYQESDQLLKKSWLKRVFAAIRSVFKAEIYPNSREKIQ